MYLLRYFLVLVFLPGNLSLKAQEISEQQIKNYFPNRINSISKKLYLAGMDRKIKTYYSDSLQFLRTLEDIELRSKTYHVVQRQIGPDPEDVMDTMYWTLFHTDSLYDDLMISYGVKNGFNDLNVFPKAISPIFRRNFAGITVAVNLFWIDWNELQSALSPDEVFFLNKYSQWKQFEATHGLRNRNDSLPDMWDQWESRSLEPVYNLSASKELGPFLINRFKSVVLRHLLKSEIHIYSLQGEKIGAEQFSKMHPKIVVVPLSAFAPTFDSEGLGDTSIYKEPETIDSISFENSAEIRKYFIHQKLSGSNTYITYTLPEKDLKRLFSNEYWYMLQSAIQNN